MPALPNTIRGLAHIHLSDLAKRDNMGYAIHPSLIVLIIIFGAGCIVACAFAVYQLFGNVSTISCFLPDLIPPTLSRAIVRGQKANISTHQSMNADNWGARTPEQDDYMREVRHRNVSGLMGVGGAGRRSRKQGGAYAEYDSR